MQPDQEASLSYFFGPLLTLFAKELAPLVAKELASNNKRVAAYSGSSLPPGISTRRAFYEICRRDARLKATKVQRGWSVTAERWAAWLEAKNAPRLRLVASAAVTNDENAFRAALGIKIAGSQ